MSESPGPSGDLVFHVVRHAHALERAAWGEDDMRRPLSEKGRRQADALAEQLAACAPTTLWSSPARRCQATLEPLAQRARLGIETLELLAEGSSGGSVLDALVQHASMRNSLVACTHGDVIASLLEAAARRGASVSPPQLLPKAGTWQIVVRDAIVTSAQLLKLGS